MNPSWAGEAKANGARQAVVTPMSPPPSSSFTRDQRLFPDPLPLSLAA